MQGLDSPGRELVRLEEIVLADHRERVDRALEAARELLNMDVAYLSEFTDDDQVIRRVSGDSETFDLTLGKHIPLEETYCARMVAGEIPNAIPVTRDEPGIRDLPATAEGSICSYAGVPLQTSDGRVFGTFCCASQEPKDLGARHTRLMRVLAQLVADALERDGPAASGSGPELQLAGDAAHLSLWVMATPKAVGAARRALDVLSEELAPDVLQKLYLMVSELVTNSIRHSGITTAKAVGIELWVHPRCMRVEITDYGSGFDVSAVREPDPGEVGGWGLYIVREMADRFGVESEGATVVWFELDLDSSDLGEMRRSTAARAV